MNDIKMIVTDLDRTLLRSGSTISTYTAEVLSRCRARGIKVVFATARPERNVANFTKVIPPDAVISDNGARAYAKGQTVLQRDIPPAAVTAIVEQLLPVPGIRLHLNYERTSFTNHEEYHSWGSWGVEFSDLTAYDPNGVQKIAIEAADASLLSNINFEAFGCHFYGSQGENWYMVMEASATKWNAIQAVSAHFGIPIANIAAFGDDHNDIEMLRNCGVGIAVANAIDEAKAAADDICDSNDHDGAAKWLEHAVLNEEVRNEHHTIT